MEITQSFPTRLGKQRIQANNQALKVDYKDLFREYHVEFEYSEIHSNIVRGRVANSDWFSLTFFLAVFSLILLFLIDTPHWLLTTVVVVSITIPTILGFVKHNYVVFETNKHGYHLVFWLQGRDDQEKEDMIKFILEKIKDSELKQQASL
jgi:hypothetical protein